MNFTTQCGENRHTDIANFATLIHTKKNKYTVWRFLPYSNFTQQYGKNRQRCQQNKFYYAVWQLLLYFPQISLKNSLRTNVNPPVAGRLRNFLFHSSQIALLININ